MTSYVLPPPVSAQPEPPPPMDPISATLADQLRDQVYMGWVTSPRSLQSEIGVSEVGSACERQIGYRAVGVPKCNHDENPLPSLTGIGVHVALAELFARLDGGSGRFRVESRLSYRGVPGSADLYDRRRRTVIDWKTTTKAKLRRIRSDGPMGRYTVQVQLYAAALASVGENPERVALAFLPIDGDLADLWVWSAPVDHAVAEEWVDRYERIAARARSEGPGALAATPSRLCGWCAHFRPGSTDLSTGCPGQPDTT